MGNRVNNLSSNSEHVVEQISPYLDGALDDATSDSVRAHIERCDECRAEYMEMRYTRQMLRSMSAVPPPRAFTLTQEMVARRGGLWHRLLVPRNVPRLATGSVLTFALVALLLAGNLGGIFSRSSDMSVGSIAVQKSADVPSQLTPAGLLGYNTPSDPDYLAPLSDTPVIAASEPEVAATSDASMDTSIQSAATVGTRSGENAPPQGTPFIAGGAISSTEQATAEPPQEGISPPGDLFRMSPLTDTVSQPEFEQPNSDGGQVLTFALMSLLVALGGALAVGAVVAARR
jgi:anti-sigma factor RsiW